MGDGAKDEDTASARARTRDVNFHDIAPDAPDGDAIHLALDWLAAELFAGQSLRFQNQKPTDAFSWSFQL